MREKIYLSVQFVWIILIWIKAIIKTIFYFFSWKISRDSEIYQNILCNKLGCINLLMLTVNFLHFGKTSFILLYTSFQQLVSKVHLTSSPSNPSKRFLVDSKFIFYLYVKISKTISGKHIFLKKLILIWKKLDKCIFFNINKEFLCIF